MQKYESLSCFLTCLVIIMIIPFILVGVSFIQINIDNQRHLIFDILFYKNILYSLQ